MKDEGVTKSQVYSHESLGRYGGEKSCDLNLFTFPISPSFRFDLRFLCVAGNLNDQQHRRRGKKQINFDSNTQCLLLNRA